MEKKIKQIFSFILVLCLMVTYIPLEYGVDFNGSSKVKKVEAKEEVKEVKKVEKKAETKDYSKMTLAELKVVAKEQGLKGYSTMKKDELISNLK